MLKLLRKYFQDIPHLLKFIVFRKRTYVVEESFDETRPQEMGKGSSNFYISSILTEDLVKDEY